MVFFSRSPAAPLQLLRLSRFLFQKLFNLSGRALNLKRKHNAHKTKEDKECTHKIHEKGRIHNKNNSRHNKPGANENELIDDVANNDLKCIFVFHICEIKSF